MKKIVPADAILIPANAKRVFQGVIYDVYQWQQELFDGSEATFEMLRRPDTVSVICIVDGKILVLNDEQPNRGVRLSFPGGRADVEGEDMLQAAQREVLEETGYTFSKWRLIRVGQPQHKLEWFIYLFIAWDVEEVKEPQPDAGERITPQLLPLQEVKRLVADERDLREAEGLFEDMKDVSDILTLSEFQGKEIEVA